MRLEFLHLRKDTLDRGVIYVIVYKVVTHRRCSVSVVSGKYCLRYPKGKVVEAPSGTLGIMCFESFENVYNWCISKLHSSRVIVVEGLSKPRRPRLVSAFTQEEDLDRHYKLRYRKTKLIDCLEAPEGTVCFDKVKVLT